MPPKWHPPPSDGVSPTSFLKDRLLHFALFVWAALIVLICTRSFLFPERASVYPIFSQAARSWYRGEDCYRPVLHDQYRYSPPATILLTPFAMLPDALGGILWRLAGAAAFLVALGRWMRHVLPRPIQVWEAGGLLLLVLPLSLSNLNNGQSNVLVTGLVLATAAAVARQHWDRAAVYLALATLIKGYPLAIALLLAALFPRRFAGRFVVALLVGLGLPFLCQQPGYVVGQYQSWVEQLRHDDRQEAGCEGSYRDVRLLCRVAGVPLSGEAFVLLQMASGAGVLGVCLLGRRAGWPRRRLSEAVLNLGCCWMVLFGPATESCTYILLAPPLAWALLETFRSRHRGPVAGLLLVGAALLLACCVAGWFPFGRSVRALGTQPLAGLLVLGNLLLRLSDWAIPARIRLGFKEASL